MESEDYHFYQGLVYLLENDVSTLGYDLTFSTEVRVAPSPGGPPDTGGPQDTGDPPMGVGTPQKVGIGVSWHPKSPHASPGEGAFCSGVVPQVLEGGCPKSQGCPPALGGSPIPRGVLGEVPNSQGCPWGCPHVTEGVPKSWETPQVPGVSLGCSPHPRGVLGGSPISRGSLGGVPKSQGCPPALGVSPCP